MVSVTPDLPRRMRAMMSAIAGDDGQHQRPEGDRHEQRDEEQAAGDEFEDADGGAALAAEAQDAVDDGEDAADERDEEKPGER